MASFDEMRRITNSMAREISEITGVKISLVLNVIQYTRQLAEPTTPDAIKEHVFIAQMGHRFGITSLFHLKLMFEALRIKNSKLMRVEEYVKLICIFYSQRLDLKINFVFSVYDYYHDNNITPNEMATLLKTSIISSAEDDPEEHLKELIDIVMMDFDKNKDGVIDLEEFRSLVHKNILYIQLLGQVLPHKAVIDDFMDLLRSMSIQAVGNHFAYERLDCLSVPRAIEDVEALFPVPLEFP